ncbi:hypothetical protein HAX54_003071, partial [Datura stramonium]|nr:hypothetical protein [Datura stramonium]
MIKHEIVSSYYPKKAAGSRFGSLRRECRLILPQRVSHRRPPVSFPSAKFDPKPHLDLTFSTPARRPKK